jgi:hypothetical protein
MGIFASVFNRKSIGAGLQVQTLLYASYCVYNLTNKILNRQHNNFYITNIHIMKWQISLYECLLFKNCCVDCFIIVFIIGTNFCTFCKMPMVL